MSREIDVADEQGFVEVGQRLREARAKIGMTRRQLAIASNTSERYLANIETGTGNPSLVVLTNLAVALDVAVAELLPSGGERDTAHARLAALMRRLPPARVAAALEWMRQPSEADASKGQRIVLVGLRGAGKSSLGGALAERMNMRFVEISKEVAAAYGGQIGLLIELGGQSVLRRYEREAWEAVLVRDEPVIVATPGGIVAESPLYDRILATAHSVWLQASPTDHMNRVLAQGDFRPMKHSREALEDLKAILEARAAEYSRADAKLNTSAQNFHQTLDALEAVAKDLLQKV